MNSGIFQTATFLVSRSQDSKKKRVNSMSGIEDVPHSIKFAYMNIKPKNSFATPPSTKVISARPATGNNLGPGKYRITSHSRNPSFEFSRSPRFGDSYDLTYKHLFKRLSEEDKEKINLRIEKNKQYAVLSVSTKKKIAQEKAMKNAVREKVSKLAKLNILKELKIKKENNIKEKLKKYEYRKNIDVYHI